MGTRSPALGGTGIAGADTWEATYENPAGLVQARDRRLTLGYLYGHFRTSIDDRSRSVDDTHATLIGATLPFPLGGVMKDRLTLGLGFVLPAGVVTRARVPPYDEARMALLDTRTQVVGVDVAAALRVTDRLSLGFGALALAALTGRVELTADAAGRIGALSNQQLIADYAPIAGARYEVSDWLVVGAAFRGESRAGFDVRVDNRLGDKLPIGLPLIRIQGVAQFDPMQAGLEAAGKPLGARTVVAAGVTWKHWSAFPRPTESPTAESIAPPEPGFSDTFVPRLGVEHALGAVGPGDLALRGGAFAEPAPAPDGTPYLDNHRVAATLGAGYRAAPFQIDLFYQWHLLLPGQRSGGMLNVAGLTVGVDL
jgi:long-chain fatty acid transport protein